MTLATLVLVLVTIQRLGELVLARSNTQRLLKMGAYEVGAGHYPLIVVLHAAWIAAIWIFGHGSDVNLYWLFVFVMLQIMRVGSGSV